MPINWKDRTELIKMGASTLVVCIVQTLSESDPTFQTRFLSRLEKAYMQLRDSPAGGAPLDCLELLVWVKETLKTGQVAPRS